MQLWCISWHFSEVTQVDVKPLDIARLLNMFMQKQDVSFFKYKLKTSMRTSWLVRYNLTNVYCIEGVRVFKVFDMY